MIFRGLNTTPDPTDIAENESVTCLNCDLSEGIKYLAYPTSFTNAVKYGGNTFTISGGAVLRDSAVFYNAAPAAAPVISEEDDSDNPVTLDTYDFIITYINDTGEESQGSAAATHVLETDDKKLRITFDTDDVPSGWKVRIYARGNESYTAEFMLLHEIGTIDDEYALGYWDWTGETLLDAQNGIYSAADNGVPPSGAEIIWVHNSILWVSVGQYLYYSKVGELNAFPTNQRFTMDADITGLCSASGELIVSTATEITRIIGTNPDNFQKVKTSAKKGCVRAGSFISVSGNVVYIGSDGLYEFNGMSETKISEKVNDQFSSLAATITTIFDGRYYDINNSTGKVRLDIIRGNWINWDTSGTWSWQSKEFMYNMLPHQADRLIVDYKGTLTMQVYFDGTLKDTYTLTSAARVTVPKVLWLPSGRFSRISIKFTSNGTSDELYSWKFFGGQ